MTDIKGDKPNTSGAKLKKLTDSCAQSEELERAYLIKIRDSYVAFRKALKPPQYQVQKATG
jgi:hypothetical protein